MKTDGKHSWLDRALAIIPRAMASRLSVFIFLFLFCYLVIYTLLCIFIPALNDFIPDDNVQLVLGNYTNILSALGASIAAGSGVAIHSKIKTMHEDNKLYQSSMQQHHDHLRQSIDHLHGKIDGLQKKLTELEGERKEKEKR